MLAEALVEPRARRGRDVEVLDRFPGAALDGVRYEPPFPFLPASEYGERGHTVLLADFVTADDGTGLVHTAIAFGEDDFRLGAALRPDRRQPGAADGTYDERIGPYAGRFVKDADPDLIEDLERRGLLLRAEELRAHLPALLALRARRSSTTPSRPGTSRPRQLRDRLLAANETVDWHPRAHQARALRRLAARTTSTGRSRASATGARRCRSGAASRRRTRTSIGSFDELEELSGVRLEDPHRPYVDEVGFPCPQCHGRMRRVPEVIDVWFDSGAMPFAQEHAPFEHEDRFARRFPADFICEALDQTRGWFYSLLAISVLLFDRAPYEHVVCLGLILDGEGQKMSKSKGNIVVPWEVLDRFGADAFRWYFFTSKQPWDGYRFSTDAVGEGVRLFLRQLWNTYAFLSTYEPEVEGEETELDRWVRSRLSATVAEVTERLEDFDATTAGRAIAAFVDDLSNWYVRRSRRRFWEGDGVAFATLRECLLTTAQLLAPFTPFMADEIYETLDGGEPSVHLTRLAAAPASATSRSRPRWPRRARRCASAWPRAGRRRSRSASRCTRPWSSRRAPSARRSSAWPTSSATSSTSARCGSSTRPTSWAPTRSSRTTARWGRASARRCRRSPQAVAALDPGPRGRAAARRRARRRLRRGPRAPARPGGPAAGAAAAGRLPARARGLARGRARARARRRSCAARASRARSVHAVQGARKAAGLAVEDRIALALGGDDELLAAAREHEATLAREVLATAIHTDLAPGEGDAVDDRGPRAAHRRRARLAAPRRQAASPAPRRPAAGVLGRVAPAPPGRGPGPRGPRGRP